MIKEVIDSILEAEEQAENIRQEGIAEAKAIVSQAEQEALSIRNAGYSEAKAKSESILEKGNGESTQAVKELLRKSENTADAIRKAAEKNMDKAIDYIVGRLLANYGTR